MTTLAKSRKAVAKAEAEADQAMLALKAYKLKAQGYSLWEIAEECKVTEAAASHLMNQQIVEAAKLVTDGAKILHLTLEVDRLDQLQRSIWRQAMSGDLAAVREARGIIHERAALLNLGDMSTTNITNNTVVIAGTSPEYIEALKAYATAPLAIEE